MGTGTVLIDSMSDGARLFLFNDLIAHRHLVDDPGCSYSELKANCGGSEKRARRLLQWERAYRRGDRPEYPQVTEEAVVLPLSADMEVQEEHGLDFETKRIRTLEEFRRVTAPARPAAYLRTVSAPSTVTDGVERVAVVPDIQVGFEWYDNFDKLHAFHDMKAVDVMLQWLQLFKPHRVVLLGDNLDLAPWSTHFKRKPQHKRTTQPSLDVLYWILREIRRTCPLSTITYMEGNHELRIANAINELLEEAAGVRAVGDELGALEVRRLLALDTLKIEYTGPYGEEGFNHNGIHFSHGPKKYGSGGASAAKSSQVMYKTNIFGHTHTQELSIRTIRDEDSVTYATSFSPGCLCKTDGSVPGKGGPPDWQQGVGEVLTDLESKQHQIHPIQIVEGRALTPSGIILARDRLDQMRAETGWHQLAD